MPVVRLVLGILLAWLVAALLGRWVTNGLLLLDPFLLLTVYVGVRSEPPRGTLTGFAAGLCQDALTGTLFGMNGFVKTLVGYLCHGSSGRFLLNSPAPLVLLVAGSTLLDRFLLAVLSLLLRGTFPLPSPGVLVLVCICNSLAGLALFRFADARDRRLSMAY